MKLLETIRYELSYQARRPVTWLFFAAVLLLMFHLTTEGEIADAKSGDAPVNAPFGLAVLALFGSFMTLLPIAAMAGEAAARDVQARITPLFYTTPVKEATYVGGRYIAALILGVALAIAIPAAVLLAVFATDVDPALLGPVRFLPYAGAWVGVTLPNVIVATTFAFAAAMHRGRAMAGFGAVAALFIVSLICTILFGVRLNAWGVAALLDPLSLTSLVESARAWGPEARRTGYPYLRPQFLQNRALWLLISAGVLMFVHRRFHFAHRAGSASGKRDADIAAEPASIVRPVDARRSRREFGAATHARQLALVTGESYRLVVFGLGGLVMIALALLIAIVGPELMEQVGVPLVPTTSQLAAYLSAPTEIVTLAPPMLIAYYAGELVWRDRDAGLGEIADAAPVPDWTYVLGRAGGLALALVTYQMLLMLAGVVVQLRMGYYDFEPWLYVRLFLGVHLADWLLFVALAVAIHVITAQKYVGHMLVLGTYAFILAAPRLGVEHRLLIFAADPALEYSDMRGFGRSLGPWLSLQLYWAGWALLLLVAGALMWMRGPEKTVGARLRLARTRLTRPVVTSAAGAGLLVLLVGGYVFYNTNVLNAFEPSRERDEARAEYELRYGRYQGVPQPLLQGVRLHVGLQPQRGVAEIRARYTLVHRDAQPVDSIHLAIPMSGDVGPVTVDRPASTVLSDDRLGNRILALAQPLQRGDTLRLAFSMTIGRPGFSNDGVDEGLTANGTFLRSSRLPAIGYRRTRELSDRGVRTDYGLPERAETPALEDRAVRGDIALAGAERIHVETVISTAPGERAMAPGALVREWVEDGRPHFHYATGRPIRNDYAIFSADYAIRRARWRDVAIEVAYERRHARNVDAMVNGIRASLEHLSATLNPYLYEQARFVEHPGTGGTLHAFPVNVSYEEGFRRINSASDVRRVDFPFAVAAHEMAHHWWGDQLSPARMEGAGLLAESLAWYSALGVVEHTYGREHMERLVGIMREAYLPPRAPADPPLLRASGWFLSYRKGPLAMYALREYIGADRVTQALRALLRAHPPGTIPLASTRELHEQLLQVTPDSLRYLVGDLFAANTAWELATDSVSSQPVASGMVELTLDVSARKIVIDTAGVQREVPMNDLVEIGVFAKGEGDNRGAPLYSRWHRIRTGTQRITITVPAAAASAGVDPRQLLFDFKPGDNVRDVRARGDAGGKGGWS